MISDYAVVKFNSSGVLQWVKRYNGPGNSLDEVYAFTTDAEGNSYITGNCRNINNSDYTTIKYSSSGEQQWVSFYNGPDDYYDGARAICLDANSNVLITGFSSVSVNNNNFDYSTVKYNSSGVQQWVGRYNGAGNSSDYASAIACDISNNVYVSGVSWSGTKYEFATIKYNSAGNLKWVQMLGGTYNSGSEYVSGIVVDSLKCLYIGGYLSYSGTGMDYTTVKFGQLVKAINNISELPYSFSLNQNYPNPFNPSTRIRYDLPKAGVVRLAVYDVMGREVEMLVNESQPAGSYEATFDGTRFASGVYFYRLTAERYVETRKMMLIR